jgi:hypothetical protein
MLPRIKGSTVAAGLAFTLAAALPFQPWANPNGGSCSFEINVESDESGLTKLFYDVGRGFNERDSAVQVTTAGHPRLLTFALPSGRLTSLRLDPLDRDVRMTLSGARIVDRSGRTLARFEPGLVHPAHQIESLVVSDGKLLISTNRDADNPQLAIDLASPLVLSRAIWWEGIALAFAGLLAILLVFDLASRSPKVRLYERARSFWEAASVRPGRAILATATLATLVANYPVVFAGKSLVSPNLGSALLYGQNPWVPGFQSIERGNPNSADIDALMWAHLPYSIIQHRALFNDWEPPLWNRYNSTGTPLLGQGQSCFGDPLQLIPLAANGAPWAWDVKFLLAKWLLACGIGFCLWRLTGHLSVSLLMAASAQFIGFFVYRINHPAIFSLCYSPWILYCWIRIVDGRSARGSVLWMAALLGANLTELSSGTIKEAYVLLLWMNFTGICILLMSARSLRNKLLMLGGVAVESGLFTMIGSPAWYTFYRALKNSYTTYEAPQAFQIQPGMFVGLFDELFYRPFQIFANVINPSANFFVLVGLLWAAVRWRSVLMSRYAVALVISSLPALILVFGVIPPGVITRVPFLGNILHIDNTFSCALIIVFTLLAGVGWIQAWESLGSRDGRRESIAVLVLLIGLQAIYLGTAQAIVRSAFFEHTWGKIIKVDMFVHVYGCSLVAATALLMWAMHRARKRGLWTPALILYAVLGFAALHWRNGLQVGMAFPEYVIMPTKRVDLQAPSPSIESILACRNSPFRAVGFVDNFFPGWSVAYDLEGITGPDALINRYYRQLMDASGIEQVWDWRYKLEDKDLKTVRPLLDALNVRFYLDYPAGERRSRKELRPFLSSDMEVYESPSFWPRAFFTDSVAVYDDLPQYWSWIKWGDGRPFAAIQRSDWIRLSPLPRVSGDLSTRRIKPAEDYRLTTNTTSFTVSATGPGFIVLTEAYERNNFRATLNGAEVPYLRINHAFKGIYVDSPGTYLVKFAYWPRDFFTTLVVSGSGLGLALLGISAALFSLKPPTNTVGPISSNDRSII